MGMWGSHCCEPYKAVRPSSLDRISFMTLKRHLTTSRTSFHATVSTAHLQHSPSQRNSSMIHPVTVTATARGPSPPLVPRESLSASARVSCSSRPRFRVSSAGQEIWLVEERRAIDNHTSSATTQWWGGGQALASAFRLAGMGRDSPSQRQAARRDGRERALCLVYRVGFLAHLKT